MTAVKLKSLHQRKYRARRKRYGGSTRISSTIAAELIEQHQQAGIGLRELAAASGVERRTLQRCLRGELKYVLRETHQRLVDVYPEPAGGSRMPSLGARRRFEDLQLSGWSLSELARRFDTSPQNLQQMVQGEQVTYEVHQRFSRLYDELGALQPPSKYTPHVARRAREKGYVPALAYDNIDDPNERPKGVRPT